MAPASHRFLWVGCEFSRLLGRRVVRCDEVRVLRVTAYVRADEGAHRNDLQPSRAQIVEGAADELGAKALAPRLDLRVDEREPARNAPVADLAGELAVVVQL